MTLTLALTLADLLIFTITLTFMITTTMATITTTITITKSFRHPQGPSPLRMEIGDTIRPAGHMLLWSYSFVKFFVCMVTIAIAMLRVCIAGIASPRSGINHTVRHTIIPSRV